MIHKGQSHLIITPAKVRQRPGVSRNATKHDIYKKKHNFDLHNVTLLLTAFGFHSWFWFNWKIGDFYYPSLNI